MSSSLSALEAAGAGIGTEIGISAWVLVDQALIDRFAETTGDTQWIHTDPDRAARESPFGGAIAHGFLTLSLATQFALDCLGRMPGQTMGVNYGLNRVRFLSPVAAGNRVRGRFVLRAIRQRAPGELLRETHLTVEIEGRETPALVAEWLGLAVFDS